MGCGASAASSAVIPIVLEAQDEVIGTPGNYAASPPASPVLSLRSSSHVVGGGRSKKVRTPNASPVAGQDKGVSFRMDVNGLRSSSSKGATQLRSLSSKGVGLRSQSYGVVEAGAQRQRQGKVHAGSGWGKVRLAAATKKSLEPDAAVFIGDAARRGRTDDVIRLLAEGADADDADPFTAATPLYYAARENHVSAMAALVDSGSAKLNKRDAEGVTPLM
jgi:hypothetical protein